MIPQETNPEFYLRNRFLYALKRLVAPWLLSGLLFGAAITVPQVIWGAKGTASIGVLAIVIGLSLGVYAWRRDRDT